MEKKMYRLENLGCQHCATKIKGEINDLKGVESVELDFVSGKLCIQSQRQLTIQELEQIAHRHESEIRVRSLEEEGERSNLSSAMKKEALRLVIAFALFLIGLLGKFPGKEIAYIAAYFLAGYPVLFKAAKNILRGSLFDENFLMSLATFGALGLKEYTEAVGIMIFYGMGEFLEGLAVYRSKESIKALIQFRPKTVHLKVGEDYQDVNPEEVPASSMILVKPGEMIPLDGTVIQGESSLDMRDITGEVIPAEVNKGSQVISGSINLSGALLLQTGVDYASSTVARILDLVEKSRLKKSPTEKFITKFARIYTPIVVLGALCLAFLPPLLFHQAFSVWIKRALIFLIISCPCALVTSVPLSFFGGMGAASKQGILIKGSNHVESLEKIKVAIFDKTGTLTKGSFQVKGIQGILPEKELLRLAAIGEQFSNHPIAISIRSAYPGELPKPENLKEIPGKGMEFDLESVHYILGNQKFLEEQNIDFPKEKEEDTVVHLASTQWLGKISLEDEIKSTSKKAVEELKKMDIMPIMLTGDGEERAKSVAKEVGIDHYHWAMLPEDKLEEVKEWKEEGGVVAFLGDGTNDTPSMAVADIGIAMGGVGSDAAMETSDVVFMTDDLLKLPQAIRIAKKIKSVVLQNIIFALGIKIIFLIMGALGIANIWEAIFADVGVMLLAVLNSMRCIKLN